MDPSTQPVNQPAATNPAPAPAPAPTPSPAPSPQGEFISVPKSDWELAQRQAANYKGAAPLIQKITGAGIKSEADLAPVLDMFTRTRELGVDPAQLASAFSPQINGGSPTAPVAPAPDVRSIVDQTVGVKIAEFQHQQAYSQQNTTISTIASEIAGASADQNLKDAAALMLDAAVRKAQSESFYPAGHPLADRYFAPLSQDAINKIKTEVAAKFTAIRGGQSAAPNVPTPGTLTGPTPGATAPNGPKPIWEWSKAERAANAERFFQQLNATANNSTISSV